MASPPAVLIMADAARASPELRELLGAAHAEQLEQLLLARAMRWAADLSPGGVFVSADGEELGDAAQRVLAEAGGPPLLITWPALPRWGPEHAEGVIDDLSSGCEASVGPVFDGGLYLLALARVLPALFELSAAAWDSPDGLGRVLGAINQEGATVGLLRAERGLRRPGDVRAALADPLLDDELRALLER